ncbi:MAG: OadG family protein [Lachnospiraceae bacterium]|nr:OadG family protein [Lachnospiraceae bacterium]
MSKAGLNTLLGMGTVFIVLILISLLISVFGVIPKIQKAQAEKKKAAKEAKSANEVGIENAVNQIIASESAEDDTELVAVIAAAIAAYEGSGSTDGYVVRSIRRRR